MSAPDRIEPITNSCPPVITAILHRWVVRDGTMVALRDDGYWVASNANRQKAWVINAVTAHLIALMQGVRPDSSDDAWGALTRALAQAGAFALTKNGEVSKEALVELAQDLPAILQDLGNSGILLPRDPALTVRSLPLTGGRLFLAVPPPAQSLRTAIMFLSRWGPLPLWLMAMLAGSRLWSSGQLQILWDEWLQLGRLPERALGALAAVIAIYLVHELGHAWVLAAATGKKVGIGIRRTAGIPHPYTNTTDLAVLPSRSLRLSVLLSGATAEGLLWLVAWTLLGHTGEAASMVVIPMVLTSGPLAMLASLWPYWGTDGYYALSDLTLSSATHATLAERSQLALGRMFVTHRSNPTEAQAPFQDYSQSVARPGVPTHWPPDATRSEDLSKHHMDVLDGVAIETSGTTETSPVAEPAAHKKITAETPPTAHEPPPSWLTWYALLGTLALSTIGGLAVLGIGLAIKRPDVGGAGAMLAAVAIAADRSFKGAAAFRKELEQELELRQPA